jgi:hypothetical protein
MISSHNPIPGFLGSSDFRQFTLASSQFGGRKARKGFAFQDWWIAYELVSALGGNQPFFFARVEGVEDLDFLQLNVDETIERYYQLKSMEEGSGNWTLNKLEKEGVVSRFADLFVLFEESPQEGKRQLELIVVLEGDVNKELIQLQAQAQTAARVQVMRLLATAATVRWLPVLGPYKEGVKSIFESADDNFSSQSLDSLDLSQISSKTQVEPNLVRETLHKAAQYAVDRLGAFFKCFRIESRAPSPPQKGSASSTCRRNPRRSQASRPCSRKSHWNRVDVAGSDNLG